MNERQKRIEEACRDTLNHRRRGKKASTLGRGNFCGESIIGNAVAVSLSGTHKLRQAICRACHTLCNQSLKDLADKITHLHQTGSAMGRRTPYCSRDMILPYFTHNVCVRQAMSGGTCTRHTCHTLYVQPLIYGAYN